MKRFIFIAFLFAFIQLNAQTIDDIKGRSGQPNLRQELNKLAPMPALLNETQKGQYKTALGYQTSAEADVKYPLKSDTVTFGNIAYTKHEANLASLHIADSVKTTISSGSTAWKENASEKGLRLLGSNMIAQTFGISDVGQNSITLTNGNVYYVAVELKRDTVIAGISTMVQTQGVFTGTYNSFAICLPQSGNFVKVRETATNGAIWTAAADTRINVPLTSTYSATRGVIYIAFIYYGTGQTTAPKIYAGGNRAVPINAGLAYGTTYKLVSQITGQTTIPSSTASSSAVGITGVPFVSIY